MPTSPPRSQSHWALVVDLLSAKAMVWAVRMGRDADLKPEAHVYFFDRYSRLAEYHRARSPGGIASLSCHRPCVASACAG